MTAKNIQFGIKSGDRLTGAHTGSFGSLSASSEALILDLLAAGLSEIDALVNAAAVDKATEDKEAVFELNGRVVVTGDGAVLS